MNPFFASAAGTLRVAMIDTALSASHLDHEGLDTGPHAIESVARALARLGHTVDIYRSKSAGEPVWEDLHSGVRVHRVAHPAPWPVDDQDALSRAVRGFVAGMKHMATEVYPCDAVHAWGTLSGLVGLRLTRGLAVPFVLTLKPRPEDAWFAINELLIARADGLIACSDADRDALYKIHGTMRANVHVVPRGVDLPCFKPRPKAQLRRELGLPEDAFIVMWGGSTSADIGRLRDGMPFFRMASKASAHVLVAGSDSPWPAETAGLPNTTAIDVDDTEPFQKQAALSACYGAADLLVMPPWHREVDGINAKDAMACGTPVIVLTERINDEMARVVDDCVTGYVIHRERSDLLLNRLRTMRDQPQRRAAMGMAAVLRARTFFTWQRAAERFAHIYTNTTLPSRVREDCRSLTLVRSAPRLPGAWMPAGA